MPFPTSRKKYYLSVDIKPEWTDSELIAELKDHVESRSSESVRDIFLRHSERIGCFSVKSREIAERLVSTFETVNVSCRGRKPLSEIVEISNSKFQLRLSNLNNVMSSNQFEQWVLSLREYTFDIHLFSTKIVSGCTECILSFDSIDAAISVKKTLQNSQFRGQSLYFTHWHVPRRSKEKERFFDGSSSQSQVSGYSSSTVSSSNTSESSSDFGGVSSSSSSGSSSSGPLYLTDSSVPAPPCRAPPSPPSMNNHSKPKNNYKHNGKYISSLHSQLNQQKRIIEQLVQQNALMINKINQQNDVNKYMNEKYDALCKKYESVHRRNSVLLWSVGDIIEWLTSLENGKYDKYKYHLLYNMTEEKVTGSMLSTLNVTDWHRLGVSDVKDQHDLLRHVYSLIYV